MNGAATLSPHVRAAGLRADHLLLTPSNPVHLQEELEEPVIGQSRLLSELCEVSANLS
jgi:hypothetical protein